METKIKHHNIRVTKGIIEKSMKNNSKHCMVAIAIGETIPGSYSIDVEGNAARFNIGDVRYHYPLPARVERHIADFDDNKMVDEFKFSLDARQATAAPVHVRGKKALKNKPDILTDEADAWVQFAEGTSNVPSEKSSDGIEVRVARVVQYRRSSTRRTHGFKIV